MVPKSRSTCSLEYAPSGALPKFTFNSVVMAHSASPTPHAGPEALVGQRPILLLGALEATLELQQTLARAARFVETAHELPVERRQQTVGRELIEALLDSCVLQNQRIGNAKHHRCSALAFTGSGELAAPGAGQRQPEQDLPSRAARWVRRQV